MSGNEPGDMSGNEPGDESGNKPGLFYRNEVYIRISFLRSLVFIYWLLVSVG